MTKIFFTDLDGTLLTDEKKISPQTYEILKQWTQTGHKLVLCSGRALDSILHVKETLKIDLPNVYIIGCNGGEIYDCSSETMLLRTVVPFDVAEKAFAIAKKYNIHVQTYTDTHIITATDGEELAYYKKAIHTPAIITDDFRSQLDKEPCKCLAIELHDLDRLETFRQAIIGEIGEHLTVLYSNPNYIEMFPAGSGKGFGVRWLCDYLNIPIENSLAAGDEMNDISMIEAAGLGIAMLNARDSVKEKADIVTAADNNHDGLAAILLGNI